MNIFDGYRITSPYGFRLHPVHKIWKMHTGIDLDIFVAAGYLMQAQVDPLVSMKGA